MPRTPITPLVKVVLAWGIAMPRLMPVDILASRRLMASRISSRQSQAVVGHQQVDQLLEDLGLVLRLEVALDPAGDEELLEQQGHPTGLPAAPSWRRVPAPPPAGAVVAGLPWRPRAAVPRSGAVAAQRRRGTRRRGAARGLHPPALLLAPLRASCRALLSTLPAVGVRLTHAMPKQQTRKMAASTAVNRVSTLPERDPNAVLLPPPKMPADSLTLVVLHEHDEHEEHRADDQDHQKDDANETHMSNNPLTDRTARWAGTSPPSGRRRPTSAPSMFSIFIRSRMFSGFTEPPYWMTMASAAARAVQPADDPADERVHRVRVLRAWRSCPSRWPRPARRRW